MNMFIQICIQGLMLGSMYAILTLGYNIIYSTMGMAHYAQGDIMMVGAFLALDFFVNMHLPFLVALPLAVISNIAVMLVIEKLAYSPLYNRSRKMLLLCTIGISTVLRNAAQLIWGTQSFNFPSIFSGDMIRIGDIYLIPQNLWILGIGVVLMILLNLFMKKTKVGRAMQAVSMNRSAAALMGVNMKTITMITYGLSAGLATLAGIMLAPIIKVYSTMGNSIGAKVMISAVVGGMGNMPGAILGGLLVGLVETLGGMYISTTFKEAYPVILLLIVLLNRPQGLLGRKKVVKV